MSASSKRRRLDRQFPRRERFFARGIPEPLGRNKTGIWIALGLNGDEMAYIVGTGESSMHLVAMVFATGPDIRLTRGDYATALAIAADHRKAGQDAISIHDLRKANRKMYRDVLSHLVLFPTDQRGRRVKKTRYGQLHGAMLIADGLFTAMSDDVIPWESTVKAGKLELSSIGIAYGFFNPKPTPTKNSDQSAIETRQSGQQTGLESTELAAA